MAHELGLDPLDVRRANYLTAPTFTDNDLMVNSYGLPECVDWVERASGWKARKGKCPRQGHQQGLVCLLALHQRRVQAGELDRRGRMPPSRSSWTSTARSSFYPVPPRSAQGSSTILVQTVGEILGLDLSRIRVVTGDSEVVPKDNGSYSSRVTFMVGTPRSTRRRTSSACWSNPPRQARRQARRDRMPGRALSRAAAQTRASLQRGRHRGAQGYGTSR